MFSQIDHFLFGKIREDQAREEIADHAFREQDEELTELPMMPVPQIEHGPPHLGGDEQERRGPESLRPVFFDQRVREHALAKAL
ncbi:MAG: hypothetical protein ABIR71_04300 [Chthoniobacterales bacterium]